MRHRSLVLASVLALQPGGAWLPANSTFITGALHRPEKHRKFEKQYDVKVTVSEYDSSDTA
jgi:hypothetical protein